MSDAASAAFGAPATTDPLGAREIDAGGWVVEATECDAIIARHAHDETPLTARFCFAGVA